MTPGDDFKIANNFGSIFGYKLKMHIFFITFFPIISTFTWMIFILSFQQFLKKETRSTAIFIFWALARVSLTNHYWCNIPNRLLLTNEKSLLIEPTAMVWPQWNAVTQTENAVSDYRNQQIFFEVVSISVFVFKRSLTPMRTFILLPRHSHHFK